jgi:predicted esterase
MQHHRISVRRTAHYYTLGMPGPHVKQLWIVCHGYGQLADEFMHNFEFIDDGTRLLIAPEGMHYFYRKGFDGPVGANWMTRHFREDAIQDYVEYLQGIYDFYLPQLPPDISIILLGFSQGTATICRWIMHHRPDFDHLLLWAGLPPEDLDYASAKDYLASKNLFLLYGSNDPFLTPDRINSAGRIEAENDIDFEKKVFEGGHDIPKDMLESMLKHFN